MLHFLKNPGLLGLNARNLLYIKPFNPRKAMALADDKMKTKSFLSARGIPTAKVYARIENRAQLHGFDFNSLPEKCVLKPNYGFGGEGIVILNGRKNGVFMEQGKYPFPRQKMIEQIEDILDGKFSVNGRNDTAFFEKILVADRGLLPFRPAGLPDVRIVVFNLVPVMAMLRVPTMQSRGKANVHLGGIGIGIDIAKGVTTHAMQYSHIIDELPHGGSPAGIPIPYWEEMLLVAARIQYFTNIGYLAVDLTIDEEQGPVLLEVNARAGLAVQVANLAPLRARLNRVQGLKVSSPEKGVQIAQDLFGQKLPDRQQKNEESDERPVIGLKETIVIAGDGYTIEEPCMIMPEQERTVFAHDFVAELLSQGAIEPDDDHKGAYRAKFSLGGRKIPTLIYEGRMTDPSVRAEIGRRDLKDFLIDPNRTSAKPRIFSDVKDDLRAVDRVLSAIDREITLLKYLKPVNLLEEMRRLKLDLAYQPLFQFKEIDGDVDDMERRLSLLSPDDSPLGVLLNNKRRELLLRMDLLRVRGDARKFTDASLALFGAVSSQLVAQASEFLRGQTACDLPPPDNELLEAGQAAQIFEQALESYGLHDWQVVIRETLVADCTVGGHSVYLRAGASFSREHVDALIAHEIETHVLTAENGSYQPYTIFRRGFAGYLDTQEGLAIYNQNRVLSTHHEKRLGPARSVLAIAYALEHSFADTRQYLQQELGYRSVKALTKTVEIKRGIRDTSEPGAFTKGIVYFRGSRAIEQFVAGGGDLKRLYIGKVALDSLELAHKVPGLKPPLLIPVFLRTAMEKKKK